MAVPPLTPGQLHQERPQPKPQKPFSLPEASRFPAAMLSYLQGRGIHPSFRMACSNRSIPSIPALSLSKHRLTWVTWG